jgi:hypothetical protein
MNIKLLSQKYAEEDLDLDKAIQVWKEARLAPENIREQVQNDVGVRISALDARELYKLGETKQTALKEFGMAEGDEKNCPFYAINYSNQNKNYDGMEVIAKDYDVSEGRSDLIPFNLKNSKKIKVTPKIRKAFDRVGENLFRDKFAAKYWTLKEKIGEDGKKSVYLVAIETPDSQIKHANIKEAQGTPPTTAPTNEQSNVEVSPQGTIEEDIEKKKAPLIEEGF